jgi:hypothetical protein
MPRRRSPARSSFERAVLWHRAMGNAGPVDARVRMVPYSNSWWAATVPLIRAGYRLILRTSRRGSRGSQRARGRGCRGNDAGCRPDVRRTERSVRQLGSVASGSTRYGVSQRRELRPGIDMKDLWASVIIVVTIVAFIGPLFVVAAIGCFLITRDRWAARRSARSPYLERSSAGGGRPESKSRPPRLRLTGNGGSGRKGRHPCPLGLRATVGVPIQAAAITRHHTAIPLPMSGRRFDQDLRC